MRIFSAFACLLPWRLPLLPMPSEGTSKENAPLTTQTDTYFGRCTAAPGPHKRRQTEASFPSLPHWRLCCHWAWSKSKIFISLSAGGVREEDAFQVGSHLGQWLPSTPWRSGQPQECIQHLTDPTKMHNKVPQEIIPSCGHQTVQLLLSGTVDALCFSFVMGRNYDK